MPRAISALQSLLFIRPALFVRGAMFEALRVRVPELFILGAKGAELSELGSPSVALLPELTTWRRGFGLAGRRSIVETPIVEEVISHGSANVHCPRAGGLLAAPLTAEVQKTGKV